MGRTSALRDCRRGAEWCGGSLDSKDNAQMGINAVAGADLNKDSQGNGRVDDLGVG